MLSPSTAPHPSSPPPVRAALFDMDGLLIDSEDAMSIITNTVLRRYNRPDMPWSIKAQLQGRPAPAAFPIFHDWAQLPISHDEFMRQAAELQKDHFPHTKALPGVPALLARLRRTRVHGAPGSTASIPFSIALATSSHRRTFELKTAHLQDLFAVFDDDVRVLGDDERIPRGRGKPAPDIYLLALKTVNERLAREGVPSEGLVRPEECLVFEDSVPGVEAGRRAGMQVVWCPHPGLLEEYKGREKDVLAGMMGEHKVAAETAGQPVDGKTGSIDDGWAVLLSTLEDFPYERFGISTSGHL